MSRYDMSGLTPTRMHGGDLTSLTSGLRSDRFTEIRSIGMGSEGVVYAAFDRHVGEYVAIKTLRTRTSADLTRLKLEFRALAELQHPNLVSLYELHVDPRAAWFSMEWIHGRNFTDAFAGARPDPQALLRRFSVLARPLCAAIQAIHAGQHLHRDIKPSNVLVDDNDRVVVLDFGMIGDLDQEGRLSRADSLSGTMLYMPPERIDRRRPTAAADLYSLGILFFEALTGDLPFSNDLTIAFLEKKDGLSVADRRRLARIDPRVADLIAKMVDPDPERRINLAAVTAILETLPGAEQIAAPAPPRPPRPPRLIGRDDERARVRAWLQPGPGRLIKITGPSGAGKTALLGDLVRELRSEGTRVLTGRCHPRESIAFNAIDGVVEALVGLLVIAGAEASALLEGCGPSLARVFPGFRRLPGLAAVDEGPEPVDPAELERGLGQFVGLLGRMQAKQATVLWIDDAQWADADSLHVLKAIRGVIDAEMPHLVLTSRSGEPLPLEIDHALELGELGSDDALVIARAWLRADDPQLLQRIVDESRGNPFLLRFLAEHKAAVIRSPEGGHRLVPTVVGHIIEELSPEEASVLRLLAVAGRAISLSLVRACGESQAALVALERRSLVTRATPNHRLVELAHDRLRDGVLTEVQTGQIIDLHRRVADALLRSGGDADPGATAEHLRQAQRPEEALTWAVRAAERAEESCAFDNAALWWRRASEWASERRLPTTAMARREAAVLTAAGRCAEAGALHEELSRSVDADESRLELLRAADNFLSSGQVNRGCALIKPFLAEATIPWPRSQTSAFLRTLARIVSLRFRRPNRSTGPRTQEGPDGASIDLCWSLARGLLAVDPARGAFFALEGLMRAQDAGDRGRTARHLAVVAAIILGPSGGSLALLADDFLDQAEALADDDGSDYLRGLIAVCRGQFLVIRGTWSQAREHFSRGLEILGRVPGSAWEQNIAWMGLLRVHMELGDMATMRADARAFAQRADGLGDRYAQVTAGLYEALGLLSLGRPEKARQRAQQAQRAWTPVIECTIQHLYVAQVVALSHTLEGRPDEAAAVIADLWPRLRRAQLMRIPVARIDALSLRARVGLCIAKWTPARRRQALASVRRDADELMGEERRDAQGIGRLVAGVCESMSGREDRATELVQSALTAFESQGMKCYAAVTRSLLGRWREGRTLAQSDLIRLVIAGPLGNLESMRYP
ncbi:MAG: protein kinase [Nannocystaceae bacterium]